MDTEYQYQENSFQKGAKNPRGGQKIPKGEPTIPEVRGQTKQSPKVWAQRGTSRITDGFSLQR